MRLGSVFGNPPLQLDRGRVEQLVHQTVGHLFDERDIRLIMDLVANRIDLGLTDALEMLTQLVQRGNCGPRPVPLQELLHATGDDILGFGRFHPTVFLSAQHDPLQVVDIVDEHASKLLDVIGHVSRYREIDDEEGCCPPTTQGRLDAGSIENRFRRGHRGNGNADLAQVII